MPIKWTILNQLCTFTSPFSLRFLVGPSTCLTRPRLPPRLADPLKNVTHSILNFGHRLLRLSLRRQTVPRVPLSCRACHQAAVTLDGKKRQPLPVLSVSHVVEVASSVIQKSSVPKSVIQVRPMWVRGENKKGLFVKLIFATASIVLFKEHLCFDDFCGL